MSIESFLSQENTDLLWGVIQDEDTLNKLPPYFIEHISQIFNNNIIGFYEQESKKTNVLMELNKKYIVTILNYITKHKTESIVPRGKGKFETHEDIQNDKRSQFEKELTKKQMEFTNAMTLNIPPVPKFNDKADEPIGEMEDAIRKMAEQRKYDMEQINKNYSNADSLFSQSSYEVVKENKNVYREAYPPAVASPKQHTPFPPLLKKSGPVVKYIKIDKDDQLDDSFYKRDIIDLTTKKQITWLDEQSIEIENNIFKKLKTIPKTEPTIDNETFVLHNHEKKTVLLESLQNDVKCLNDKFEDMHNTIHKILEILQK